jgi:hypothetical protein
MGIFPKLGLFGGTTYHLLNQPAILLLGKTKSIFTV